MPKSPNGSISNADVAPALSVSNAISFPSSCVTAPADAGPDLSVENSIDFIDLPHREDRPKVRINWTDLNYPKIASNNQMAININTDHNRMHSHKLQSGEIVLTSAPLFMVNSRIEIGKTRKERARAAYGL